MIRPHPFDHDGIVRGKSDSHGLLKREKIEVLIQIFDQIHDLINACLFIINILFRDSKKILSSILRRQSDADRLPGLHKCGNSFGEFGKKWVKKRLLILRIATAFSFPLLYMA